jgi:predicted NBD/HSP70 family sugar kinase
VLAFLSGGGHDAAMRIGVDLGGTKIEAVALADDGTVAARRRVATPRDDYDGTVGAIVDLVAAVATDAAAPPSAPVGVGMPGVIAPDTGLVKNANSTWLNGRTLDRDLAAALGRPLRLANDANCFAVSEAADGAGAGAAVVFGVILGTGVGGGLVVHGHIVTGANAIGGEWGHNPLPAPRDDERPGPPCYCGRSGCIERFLSGPALAEDHARITGNVLDAPTIAARAEAGDAAAEASLARYEERLARALGSVINILDPDVIVLGGGLSNLARLERTVPELWAPYIFSPTVRTQLRRAVHGDSSGVLGAARLHP